MSRLISKTETEPLDAKALRAAALRDLAEHEPSGMAPAYVEAMAKDQERRKDGNGGC